MLKGMKRAISIFLLLSVLITGCSLKDVYEYVDFCEMQSTVSELEGTEPHANELDPISILIEEKREIGFRTKEIYYYAYHTLDEKGKALYDEIFDALNTRKQEVEVSTLDVEELNRIFTCVMSDHPELFYVDGYQYTKYSVGNVITKLVFYGNYIFSEEDIKDYQKQIQKITEELILSIPADADEYQMVKAVYEYIIYQTEYDLNAENNQNILSVLLQHKSVCQGYAKTLQYILQRMGVECILVTGNVNGDGHAWNIVKVNNAYYHIDTTWGDASYVLSDASQEATIPPVNYDYMLVSDAEILSTHHEEQVFMLPVCDSEQDNYFVREDLLIRAYNEEQLVRLFDCAYEKGWKYITLKASDDNVYRELTTQLISKQKIFDFLKNQIKSVAYTENREQRTISFWL